MDALDLRYIKELAKHEEQWCRDLFGGKKFTKELAKTTCEVWRQEVETMKIQSLQYKQLDQHEAVEHFDQAILMRWFGIQLLEKVYGDQRPPLPDRPCGHKQGSLPSNQLAPAARRDRCSFNNSTAAASGTRGYARKASASKAFSAS
jgi:hypothetical protein